MNCKQGTDIITSQMIALLGKLDQSDYSRPLPLFNGSTIGQHFRHIHDFYDCIMKGVQNGRIDYALRERDVKVETEPLYAASKLRGFATASGAFDEGGPIDVVADFSSELNEERPVVASTIGRELMYAYDHAVHHLAMIKMALKVISPELEVNRDLGVAPSTLKHWKEKVSGSHS